MAKKSTKVRKGFNLVEITLALGVVGIGVAGVMGLLPVALNASKNTNSENYSLNVAEQFQAYIQRLSEKPGGWANIQGLPDTKPSTSSSLNDVEVNWTSVEGDLYDNTAISGVYGAKITSGPSNRYIDFLGDIKIWRKSSLQFAYNQDGTWRQVSDGDGTFGYGICIEISWPVGKTDDAREKRLFYTELYQ